MKDIVFTVKQQKREIWILISCFIFTNILNIVSIYNYDTEWSELWTQIFWVLSISFGFYVLSILLRLLYFGVKNIVRKNN